MTIRIDLERISYWIMAAAAILGALLFKSNLLAKWCLIWRPSYLHLGFRLLFILAVGLMLLEWIRGEVRLDRATWLMIGLAGANAAYLLTRSREYGAWNSSEMFQPMVGLLVLVSSRGLRSRRLFLGAIIILGLLNVATSFWPPESLVALRQESLLDMDPIELEDWEESLVQGYRHAGVSDTSTVMGVICSMAALLAFPLTGFHPLRIFVAIACMIGIPLTMSRGAILGTLVALAIMLLVGIVRSKTMIYSIIRTMSILLALTILGLLMWPRISPEVRMEFLYRFELESYERSHTLATGLEDRLTQNEGALAIILDHPVLGVANSQEELARRVGIRAIPHNWILALGVRKGVGVMLAVAVVMLIALARAYRHHARTLDPWSLNQFGALLAALICNLFHSILSLPMWLLVGTCLSLVGEQEGEGDGEAEL